MNCEYTTLQECPMFLKQIAPVLWIEFRDTYVNDLQINQLSDLELYLMHYPSTILYNENEVIGFYNIVDNDIGNSKYGPWFANFIIMPKYRGIGYGSKMLFDFVKNQDTTIYLWTHTSRLKIWYHLYGFEFLEKENNKYIMILYKKEYD
jgi:GNAT superfamily N-acetyltransferase